MISLLTKRFYCSIILPSIILLSGTVSLHAMRDDDAQPALWRRVAAPVVTGAAVVGTGIGLYYTSKLGIRAGEKGARWCWENRELIAQRAHEVAKTSGRLVSRHPGVSLFSAAALCVSPYLFPYAMTGAQGIYAGVVGKSYLAMCKRQLDDRIKKNQMLLNDLAVFHWVVRNRTKSVHGCPTVLGGSFVDELHHTMSSEDLGKLKTRGSEAVNSDSFVQESPLNRLAALKQNSCWARIASSASEIFWDFADFDEGQLVVDREGGIRHAAKTVLSTMAQIDSLLMKIDDLDIKVEENSTVQNLNILRSGASTGSVLSLTASQKTEILKKVAEFSKACECLSRAICRIVQKDKTSKCHIAWLQYFGL
ncbi:TPA: hypothetical protein DDZ86_04085 [Candidatus Dependentiae bacterium]|nr:MAG: hypothetical protein UW09_C0003G0165 [candidate division TM6 bacterium GW2011_GWF2_43_87]HBL98794.1 hypothetical protein [Candidatus Dependentiae bacterium]